MKQEEFTKLVEHQQNIIADAEDRITLLRREYVRSAPIKVGDVVTDAKTGEKYKVVGLGIWNDKVAVSSVIGTKKDGTFSRKEVTPRYNVVKDGVEYQPAYRTVIKGEVTEDGEVLIKE